jgi:hypothetical protein
MAKKKPAQQGKIRTREHVIADLGVNHVERQVLLAGYTVERIVHDYGLDLILFTYTPQGEPEDGGIFLQVKATERLRLIQSGTFAQFRLERADVRGWLRRLTPVILTVYDVAQDRTLWLHIQAYFDALRGFNRFIATGTITVRLPVSQVLTPDAVRQFSPLRDEAFQQRSR